MPECLCCIKCYINTKCFVWHSILCLLIQYFSCWKNCIIVLFVVWFLVLLQEIFYDPVSRTGFIEAYVKQQRSRDPDTVTRHIRRRQRFVAVNEITALSSFYGHHCCTQLGNYIHHRHLLLLSPKAGTHFTIPLRVEGWVDLDGWFIPRGLSARKQSPIQVVTGPSVS